MGVKFLGLRFAIVFNGIENGALDKWVKSLYPPPPCLEKTTSRKKERIGFLHSDLVLVAK
jgi:hypothetical protein